MRERSTFQSEMAALRADMAPGAMTLGTTDSEIWSLVPKRFGPERYEPYRVTGGHYSTEQVRWATRDPAGLLLTIPPLGPQEKSLLNRGLLPIFVDKDWMRFELGRLGEFVLAYNQFVYLHDEVLHAIGRLRDLLSAGSPKLPKLMTSRQHSAYRPTEDTGLTINRKERYEVWRKEQAKYVSDSDGVFSGAVAEMPVQIEAIQTARKKFWEAKGALQQAIDRAKRLDKPKYEAIDVGLADVVGVAASILEGDVIGLAAAGIDTLVNAAEKRKEYDEKMKRFRALIASAGKEIINLFEAMNNEINAHQAANTAARVTQKAVNVTRVESRKQAVRYSQTLVPARSSYPVAAELRMPTQVADAWHALAVLGRRMARRQRNILSYKSVIERASIKDTRWTKDPGFLQDISRLRRAWLQIAVLEPVFEADQLKIWEESNDEWEKFFGKLDR